MINITPNTPPKKLSMNKIFGYAIATTVEVTNSPIVTVACLRSPYTHKEGRPGLRKTTSMNTIRRGGIKNGIANTTVMLSITFVVTIAQSFVRSLGASRFGISSGVSPNNER